MNVANWSLVALLGLFGVVGCGDDGGGGDGDMAISSLCTSTATTCLDNHTKAICTETGAVKLAAPCASGQICEGGDCKADPAVACTDASNGCADDTTAMRCTAAHKGFDVVTCPADTKCTGAGDCRGKCIVGTSYCGPNNTLVTCADGQSYTTSSCEAGKACVYTKGKAVVGYDYYTENPLPFDPTSVAACKASECYPDTHYKCNTVCGNRLDGAAAGQDKTTSTCTETPDGWKWVVTSCGAGGSCITQSNFGCGGGVQQKTCGSACTPGEQVCTDALNYVTCGADGQWATTPTACNPSTGNIQYGCTTDPANGSKIQCADFACQNGSQGGCDAAGNFHACGADGHLAATGTACASGTCVATGSQQPGGLNPGHCVAQCLAGEERCVATSGQGSTYQACTNGLWGAPQNCASGDPCFQYDSPPPTLRKKLCGGVCAPGAKRCSDMAGAAVSSGADHYFQTCGTDGQWAAAADCTVGSCNSDPSNPALVGCIADCVPGAKVCMGSSVTVPNTPYGGTTEDGICTTAGRRPASGTACATDTYCRENQAGQSLGCVACVGGQNEFGLTDTKCGNAAGAAGSTNLFKCLANSSAWDIAGTLACVNPNNTCYPASTNISPSQTTGTYCHNEPNVFGSNAPPLTQSYLMNGWGKTCQNNYWGAWGIPVACSLAGGGAVGDCCSTHCYADPSPVPAYCGGT